MRKSLFCKWLVVMGAALGACSSDRAALEGRATTAAPSPEVIAARPVARPATPAATPVSAYASAPSAEPEARAARAEKARKLAKAAVEVKERIAAKPPVHKVAVAAKAAARPKLLFVRAPTPVAPPVAAAPMVPVRRTKSWRPSPMPTTAVAARAVRRPRPNPVVTARVVSRPTTRPATRPAPIGKSPARVVAVASPQAKAARRLALASVARPAARPAPRVVAVQAPRRNVPAVLLPDSIAPAPVAVRPLVQVAKLAAGPAQTFTLNPARDTVLRTAGRTLVRVAAGAFALAADTTLAFTGPVILQLREFATLADFLLANLTTRAADGKLLETGGALWLAAATPDGRRCSLRPGRDLHLAVPARGARRAAMRGFTADSATAGADGMRWHPTAAADPTDVVRALPPQYGPGLARLESALRGQMGFSPALAEQLLAQMPTTDRRTLRKEWSESGKVLRYTKTLKQGLDVLSIPFDVAENGTAANWGTASGYHPLLINALQIVAPALSGPWRAGTCAGRAAAMHARLLLLCYDDGMMDVEVRCDPDDWAPCEGPARARFVTDFERPAGPAPADAEAAAATARSRPPMADLLGSRYLLDASRLGWVNCYRVADASTAPKIAYVLPAGADDADVRLVFRRARVVLAGILHGMEAHFAGVPAREPVTVVAVRTDQQGQTWLALQPAVIGEPLPAALTYRAVSLPELRTALAGLEPAE